MEPIPICPITKPGTASPLSRHGSTPQREMAILYSSIHSETMGSPEPWMMSLHVYAPSLAIDSGDNTYVPAEILTDLGRA